MTAEGDTAAGWGLAAISPKQPHSSSHIAQLDVPVEVDEHILGLRIAVHQVQRMYVAQGEAHF